MGACRQRQGQAFDNDRGAFPFRPRGRIRRIEAARHPLRHPVILVRADQRQVPFDDLFRHLDEIVDGHSRIDAEIFQRPIEPLQMLPQPEDFMAEGAGGVEHRIAVLDAPVAKGNAGLALGYVFAVQIDNALIRSAHG